MYKCLLCLSFAGLPFHSFAQRDAGQDSLFIDAVRSKVKAEKLGMEYAAYLSNVIGARLQGSSQLKKALDWTASQFRLMGLENVHFERWRASGFRWQLGDYTAVLMAPYFQPLTCVPKAFSAPTGKMLEAPVVLVDSGLVQRLKTSPANLLQGKILLLSSRVSISSGFFAESSRLDSTALKNLSNYQIPAATTESIVENKEEAWIDIIREFAKKQGAVAILDPSTRGHGGIVFVDGAGSYTRGLVSPVPELVISSEHYLLLKDLLDRQLPVRLRLHVQCSLKPEKETPFNLIAELPGTDPVLKDEIVLIGAHLDSWQAASGATDNAVGCAAMMGVMQLFKEMKIGHRRTIRVVLWTGEEENMLGSQAYAAAHFYNDSTKQKMAEYDRYCVYFNLDNGAGRIRGVYLQRMPEVKPFFEAMIRPLGRLGVRTLSLKRGGGTDHWSFAHLGLPAFQFIQDPLAYYSVTHHSNADSFDKISPEDLYQTIVVITSIVKKAADMPEKFPKQHL